MELPHLYDFMEPLPTAQEWLLKIERCRSPKAYIVTQNHDVIAMLELDNTDSAIGADILRHLIECHNFWLKEKTRKRK